MRRQLLAALPDCRRRLAPLAADAPASALVSVAVDLGAGQSDWLDQLPGHGDFWYWAQPEHGDFRLGIGTALQFASAGPARFAALANGFAGLAADWRHERAPAAFVGFAFDEEARGELPNALLAVPAISLHSAGGRRHAILSTVAAGAATAVERWQGLLAEPAAPAAPAASAWTRQPAPALAERAWLARVDAALRDIGAGRLDKIVLARSIRLAGPAPLTVGPLLAALVATQPHSTVFAHACRQAIFLGASPECLASLRNGRAEADALAGTAWALPLAVAAARLDEGKNRREQELVVEAVRAALAPLCLRLAAPRQPAVLQLSRLSHLHTRVGGEAKPGVGLFDLVRALHPTPAVGGSPTEPALAWLRAHGERRGGWYSGGIGHIDAGGEGEIAVALRCALIEDCEAELYAGAGIVAGSHAAQELAETEAKLATMLDAFARAGTGSLTRTGTQ